MPTSHPCQINEILSLVNLTCPQSIFDIEMGFGRCGFLSREMLDIYNNQ